jgi:FAD/FMN-containing dehydrogenase/SAM-dependent methyltransferase
MTSKVSPYILTNDISKVNKYVCDQIYCPVEIDEIIDIVNFAREKNKKISMRGTSHTMGGHTLSELIIDMKLFKKIINIDVFNKRVTVQTGITWAELIRTLNIYKLSPMILQSYSTFTVGGTISVNAHGITSDDAIYRSIHELKIINSSSEIITCSRDINSDLFNNVIGGMGLFGIIVEVTLYLCDNVNMLFDMNVLNVDNFDEHYSNVLLDKTIEVKFARVDINNFNDIYLCTFTRNSDPIISNIKHDPNSMSKLNQLLYKWMLPSLIPVRFYVENIRNKPMDINANEYDRNSLMYESAESLAKLYEPIISLNKTHILQEYFVPHDGNNLKNFIEFVGQYKNRFNTFNVVLLNITVRYVKKDDTTFMKYAHSNMYALVFYFRISNTSDAIEDLHKIQYVLNNKVLNLGGTFYLPYLHHYSKNQLMKSYPNVCEFLQNKNKYDSNELFSNMFYLNLKKILQYYNPNLHDQLNLTIFEPNSIIRTKSDESTVLINKNNESNGINLIIEKEVEPQIHLELNNPGIQLTNAEHNVLFDDIYESNNKCINLTYQQIVSSTMLMNKFHYFLEGFLNIHPINDLCDNVNTFINTNDDKTDEAVYDYLLTIYSGNNIKTIYKKIKQSNVFRHEICEQVENLLSKLKIYKSYSGFLTYGEAGYAIKKISKLLDINKNIFILNPYSGATDIIVRDHLKPIAKSVDSLKSIESNSIDIITCMIGLHHNNDKEIEELLSEFSRILRPNGLFILREHDGYDELLPILHAAHNTFNAITGVSKEINNQEIRNFKKISQWSQILKNHSLIDTMVRESKKYDTTEDIMMCFKKIVKYDNSDNSNCVSVKNVRPKMQTYVTFLEWFIVQVTKDFAKSLKSTPFYKYPYLRDIYTYWKMFFVEYGYVIFTCSVFDIFSSYTIMALLLGFVFTFIFMLLAVFSFPINMFYSLQTEETNEIEVEIDIETHCEKTRMEIIDNLSSIKNINYVVDNIFILPRYKKFKSSMVKIALLNIDYLKIKNISGNTIVQVDVIIDSFEKRELLNQKYYNMNMLYGEYKLLCNHKLYKIPVSILLDFIRYCNVNNIIVNHIYDF